jgi:CheY-like chemotaxis protein
VRNRSLLWDKHEIAAAELRHAIIGIVLRKAVEDNPKDLELTLIALAKSNLANKVISVRDGVEAIDYLHRRGSFAGRDEGNPAAILLDMKLPKVDGLQVLEQIKGDPNLQSIPVVMLTTSREERDLLRSHKRGVNAYMVFWAVHNEPPPGSARPRRI